MLISFYRKFQITTHSDITLHGFEAFINHVQKSVWMNQEEWKGGEWRGVEGRGGEGRARGGEGGEGHMAVYQNI